MDENTRVILLIDPLNPLGSSYTEEEIKEFAEIAIENDIFLLHDVTYRDFAYNHTLCAKYAPNNTITCYSFSKIFGMAGLRLGAIISSEEVIDVVKSIIIAIAQNGVGITSQGRSLPQRVLVLSIIRPEIESSTAS